MREYIDQLGVKYYPKTILLGKNNEIFKIIGKPFMSTCNQPDIGYLGCYNDLTKLINDLL